MDFQDWVLSRLIREPANIRRLGADVPWDLHPGKGNFLQSLRRIDFISVCNDGTVELDGSFASEVLRILKMNSPDDVCCSEIGNLIPRNLRPRKGSLLQEIEKIPRVMTTFPPTSKVPYFSLATSNEEYGRYIDDIGLDRPFSYHAFKDFVLNALGDNKSVSCQELGNLLPPYLRVTHLLKAVEGMEEVNVTVFGNGVAWFSLNSEKYSLNSMDYYSD